MLRYLWIGGILLAAVLGIGVLLLTTGDRLPTLHVFIWEEYIDPEVYRLFEREFGVRVVEDNFASNEDMRAKLQAGGTVYDLIVPSDYMVTLLRREGLLQPVDTRRIPNLRHIAARFKNPPYDPEHQYSIPYQWGITGIGYNKTQVVPPPTSWRDLFEPTRLEPYNRRISMLNDMREVIGAALVSLGHSPETTDAQHLETAKELLLQQKRYLAKYDSEAFEDSLASGETVLAQGWSGEIAMAQAENPHIAFIIPTEGSFIFVDNWAIPKGARHKALAEDFIDFVLRPEISGRIVNHAWYASANDAARPFINPSILEGPSYSVPEHVNLWQLTDLGAANQLYERVWLEVKGR